MNTVLRPYNPKDFENYTYFTRHLILLLLAISSTVHNPPDPTVSSWIISIFFSLSLEACTPQGVHYLSLTCCVIFDPVTLCAC